MIYPPDDLLADLQSAIPEATQDGRHSGSSGGKGHYDYLPDLPGEGNEEREIFDVPPGYDIPAMTPPPDGEVGTYI